VRLDGFTDGVSESVSLIEQEARHGRGWFGVAGEPLMKLGWVRNDIGRSALQVPLRVQ